MNQKDRQLFDLLLKNTEKYITSKEIGLQLGISDKTARKYLNHLDEELSDNMVEIKSVSGHGFYLDIKNKPSFEQFYRENFKHKSIKKEAIKPEEPYDRQQYILRKLFFGSKILFFEDLLTELFIADSTLRKDLTEINKELKPYGLSLSTNEQIGLMVCGEEQNKRHFIMRYFLMDRLQKNMKSFNQLTKLLPNIQFEEILMIVLDEYRNQNLQLNETIIFNIVVHIALALNRVMTGNEIEDYTYIKKITSEKELQTAQNIITRLELSTGILLPEAEMFAIALHFNNQYKQKNLSETGNQMKESVVARLKKLEQETGFNYAKDSILIEDLTNHLTLFLLRFNENNETKNPLLKEIKESHLTLFEQTKKHFSKLSCLEDKHISEDEWAYLTLHIMAAHERELNANRINTLVICATGIGSSQMLKSRLENELGSKLVVSDVISYFEITDDKLKDIDLIVSSIELSNFIFNVPVVNVSVLLNTKDIQAINQRLSILKKEYISYIEAEQAQEVVRDKNEIIQQNFTSELFLIDREIKTRTEVLECLIEKSCLVDPSIQKDFLKSQLALREEFSSVVFAEHIAVPHPIEGVSEQAKVAILLTPNGVFWGEGQSDIQLTFLMLPDRYNSYQLEEVSKLLLPIFEEPEAVKALVQTSAYTEFINELKRWL